MATGDLLGTLSPPPHEWAARTSVLSDVTDPGQGLVATLLDDLQVAYLGHTHQSPEHAVLPHRPPLITFTKVGGEAVVSGRAQAAKPRGGAGGHQPVYAMPRPWEGRALAENAAKSQDVLIGIALSRFLEEGSRVLSPGRFSPEGPRKTGPTGTSVWTPEAQTLVSGAKCIVGLGAEARGRSE